MTHKKETAYLQAQYNRKRIYSRMRLGISRLFSSHGYLTVPALLIVLFFILWKHRWNISGKPCAGSPAPGLSDSHFNCGYFHPAGISAGFSGAVGKRNCQTGRGCHNDGFFGKGLAVWSASFITE